jgi:hypothetical protein
MYNAMRIGDCGSFGMMSRPPGKGFPNRQPPAASRQPRAANREPWVL